MTTPTEHFGPTKPGDRPKLTFSFRRLLPEGVTLASAVATIAVADGYTADGSAASRLDGAVIVSSPYAQQFLLPSPITKYEIAMTGTFSDGQIETIDADIEVKAKL